MANLNEIIAQVEAARAAVADAVKTFNEHLTLAGQERSAAVAASLSRLEQAAQAHADANTAHADLLNAHATAVEGDKAALADFVAKCAALRASLHDVPDVTSAV